MAGYAAGSDKPAVRLVHALAGPIKFLADGAAPNRVMRCGSSSPTCAGTREFFAVGIYRAAKDAK
ncbi:MAG: hypothetical protein ACRDPL_07990 [Propionibacteriaceae bacterium]